MKFNAKFLLVAVCAALALVSCNKDNDKQEAKFDAPKYANKAVKVTINDSNASVDLNGKAVSDIEFTESGYAVIGTTAVKAEGDEIIVAPYTYENGEYVIPGFGTVKIENGKITVTTSKGTVTVNVSVTETATPAQGSQEWNLCRAWTVADFKIVVKGRALGSNGVGKLFTNPSMAAVKTFLVDNKVNIPQDVVLEDYDIVDVNFTNQNTFFINFANAAPFVGVWDVTARGFHYDLTTGGNYIFNGTADGKIAFEKRNGVDYCIFTVKGAFQNGNDSYTTEVVLSLKAK